MLRQGVEGWNAWRRERQDAAIDLSGADLAGAVLEGVDLSRADCENADFSRARLDHADLSSTRLKGAKFAHASAARANFTYADLDGASLMFARLDSAVFLFAKLNRADLRGATLSEALLEDAELRGANLSHAQLNNASLSTADCTDASFADAHLDGVNLTVATLQNANVASVHYDTRVLRRLIAGNLTHPSVLWRRRFDIMLDTSIRCKGMNSATCFGSQRFRTFLHDLDYLEEMLETRAGRIGCFFWWLFADCGRSISRWAGWAFLLVMVFATTFRSLGPSHFHVQHLKFNLLTMMYYSVVTFSTLGFGDIAPKSPVAAVLVVFEVILGYLMLGGLIAIFAGKLSRRSS